MLLSFVIPCYGSEETIEAVYDEIVATVSSRPGFDYEIVAVNDGSPDHVLEKLKGLALKDPKVKVLDFARNRGKTNAQMAGFHYAQGEIIVCLDDDFQCPADKTFELIEPLFHDADAVSALYPEKKQSRFKNFGSAVNDWMMTCLIGKPRELKFTNFTAMKRFVMEDMLRYTNPYPYIEGLMLQATSHIENVVLEERNRLEGEGNFTFIRSLKEWLNGVTTFSVIPLRAAMFVGVFMSLFAFLYGLALLIGKLLHPSLVLEGWTSTMLVIVFVGGILMFMLGVLGEYVGRMYISLNQVPQFTIRQSWNLPPQAAGNVHPSMTNSHPSACRSCPLETPQASYDQPAKPEESANV